MRYSVSITVIDNEEDKTVTDDGYSVDSLYEVSEQLEEAIKKCEDYEK